ncbi:MAG: hypothetical protein GXP29_09190 [Planctomycetes bacterium]|nr:hypothetical protein [Planctomycetota bacterium]
MRIPTTANSYISMSGCIPAKVEAVQYRSIGVSDDNRQVIVCEYISKSIHILESDSVGEWKPRGSVPVSATQSPISCVFCRGKYFVGVTSLDFEDDVVEYDPVAKVIRKSSISFGTDPPQVQSYGAPILMRDKGSLVFYCGVLGVLQWLREDNSVETARELCNEAVVGMSANGGIIYAFQQAGEWVFKKLLKDESDIVIHRHTGDLGDYLNGVCLDINGDLWVCDQHCTVRRFRPKGRA